MSASGAGGVLVIDKPQGLTSFDVLRRLRRIAGLRKMGHTGTLDPMATGVLVVCSGVATRLVPYLMASTKVYEGEVRFGASTDTDDAEGKVIAEAPVPEVEPIRLRTVLDRWTGVVQQRPPAYSALHVDGVRAHALARAGEVVELAEREVHIEHIEVLETLASGFTFRAVVGKGTYLRSLARDVAVDYGTLGHLVALRRTRNGAFGLDQAHRLEMLQEMAPEDIPWMGPWEALRDMPTLEVSEEQAQAFRHGKKLSVEALHLGVPDAPWWRAGRAGELVAIVERDGGDSSLIRVRTGMPTHD